MLRLRGLQGCIRQVVSQAAESSGPLTLSRDTLSFKGFEDSLCFLSHPANRQQAWASLQPGAAGMVTSTTGSTTEAGVNPLMQGPPSVSPAGAVSPANQVPARPSGGGNGATQATSILRNCSISPKKLDLAARLVRRMHIDDALLQMKVKHKKAAKMVHEQLWAARANAMNNHGLNPDRLCVERAEVGKGQYLKRMWPHGRGKSGIRHKYRSHLTIVLKEGNAQRFTRVIPSLMERRSKIFSTPAGPELVIQ
ncbi:hypothetical protein WJX74_010517 [Apatococcus lobatus]|uniref:Ribosomal protein L22 n=1 Tax=Apatococcus lobatus TaxID=904363 RepID=A0AAW1QHR3_9CHLO